MRAFACVCVCVCACVRACVCVCECVCVRARAHSYCLLDVKSFEDYKNRNVTSMKRAQQSRNVLSDHLVLDVIEKGLHDGMSWRKAYTMGCQWRKAYTTGCHGERLTRRGVMGKGLHDGMS